MFKASLSALAVSALFGLSAADVSAQLVVARFKADDHHMVFLSTSDAAPGVLMSQGSDWKLQHDSSFYLYGNFSDYYVHVWVQDLGAGLAGVMGDLRINNVLGGRRCKFDNGSHRITTNTTDWRATNAQPQSTDWTPVPGDFGGTINNDMPEFVQPTLVPIDLGDNTNGGSPWRYYTNSIDPTARYLNNPANTAVPGEETWFVTHIHCKPPQ